MREKYAGIGPFATVITVAAVLATTGVALGPAWGRPGYLAGVIVVGAIVAATAMAEQVRYARFRSAAPRVVLGRVIERHPTLEPARGSASRGFFFPRAEIDVEIDGCRETYRCDWDEWRRLPPGATRRMLTRGGVICDVESAN